MQLFKILFIQFITLTFTTALSIPNFGGEAKVYAIFQNLGGSEKPGDDNTHTFNGGVPPAMRTTDHFQSSTAFNTSSSTHRSTQSSKSHRSGADRSQASTWISICMLGILALV
ncbi:uncharacterized protein KGF55_000947 [Candida pseudojiufengensis]|uniref:uncharacterized protein n=1 Tax=Candida pseudojiufengensis TaxID=497109 RepID=UPI0022256B0C|nr:uncharacterized protein KGF55_000947 [Candida pseudojiufengensis]KAI5965585.1 hypothetical protein KGF55_000947 [Candida pseudojiufengensis]